MKTLSILLLGLLIVSFSSSCGYSSKSMTPAQPGMMPTISQLVPSSTTHGAASFSMTVNGSNFASNATVNWNGTALTTTFMTSGQLVGAVPASMVMNAGTATVFVTNPAVAGGIYGGGTMAASSNSMTFTIN